MLQAFFGCIKATKWHKNNGKFYKVSTKHAQCIEKTPELNSHDVNTLLT
jgi:hypothetical protein